MRRIENIAPIGNLAIGFADTKEELKELQKLRYDQLVLCYDDHKAKNGSDASEYDDFCDHLIVKDLTNNKIVGTYRVMTNKHLVYKDSFITETEFDITNLKNSGSNIVELSRAVVDDEYRNGAVIKLLWHGIFDYCEKNDIRYMFGTASFHGVDSEKYKNAFSYLHYNSMADENVMCFAKEPSAKYQLLEKDQIDMNAYKEEMPSLIKGYLALGSQVGKGVYIDYEFNSIDVLIIFDLEKINRKFAQRMFMGGVS